MAISKTSQKQESVISDYSTSAEMGIEWVKEQSKRVEQINELYKLDGRDDPSHPHAHTFTGLHQEFLVYQEWLKNYSIFKKWEARFPSS